MSLWNSVNLGASLCNKNIISQRNTESHGEENNVDFLIAFPAYEMGVRN